MKNTIENAKMHGVEAQVNVVTADVFNHEIFVGKKFDLIYWNLPWAGQHTEPGIDVDLLMRSVLDPGHQSFRRYLLEAKNFLKKTGRIFVVFSFDVGSKELFDRMVSETGWSYKIYSINNIPFEIAKQDIDVCLVEFVKREEGSK